MTYQMCVGIGGQQWILRSDGACIPTDFDNSDYQRYLEWVAAGGIPEPWNGA